MRLLVANARLDPINNKQTNKHTNNKLTGISEVAIEPGKGGNRLSLLKFIGFCKLELEEVEPDKCWSEVVNESYKEKIDKFVRHSQNTTLKKTSIFF